MRRHPEVFVRPVSVDEDRWPAAVEREREESWRTYEARCVVARAQEIAEQAEPPGERGVPLPTVEQGAAMELVSAGDEVAAQWRSDPEEAAALVRELVAGGELAVGEVLDQAVDAAVLAELLTLQQTRTAPVPNTAAELCLSALPHLVLAITLASADLD